MGQEKANKLEIMRHSFSHVLAAAVLDMFPDTKLGTGPATETGFYYDFQLPRTLIPEDLEILENKMKEIIKANYSFDKAVLDINEAAKKFTEAGQHYKVEIIRDLEKEGAKEVTIYSCGPFVDLCAGPHIDSTRELPMDAFKLNKISGAYWHANENNTQMQRIYGLAFSTKKELKTYLKNLEEAEKRDHRKIGKDQELFLIDPTVGLGLALWQPKGALLWRIIEDFWYQEHLKNGYELVRTPHIGSRKLWEISGHWGFYNESMYPPLEVGQSLEDAQLGKKAEIKEEYLLKPMNCPLQIIIYKANQKSYRDLPLRWAECGTVYRYEKSGELSGLVRVRGFTQDDAHIITTKETVEEELEKVVDFILFIYKSFGFDIKDVEVSISLRDPNNKKKYSGNDSGWEMTQEILEKVAKNKKLDFHKEEGEAAFYGPKLDFKIKDVLGRKWQCSTLQFDFNLPDKFDMSYINDKGEKEQPFVLHRALFGSFERFIGLLIEHYAGAFPLWLSPVQVKIIPVSEKFADYSYKVMDELKEKNIRVEMSLETETLGKRIREAEKEKVPYMLIIGEKEVEAETVTIRTRGEKKQETLSKEDFTQKILKEIQDKK